MAELLQRRSSIAISSRLAVTTPGSKAAQRGVKKEEVAASAKSFPDVGSAAVCTRRVSVFALQCFWVSAFDRQTTLLIPCGGAARGITITRQDKREFIFSLTRQRSKTNLSY